MTRWIFLLLLFPLMVFSQSNITAVQNDIDNLEKPLYSSTPLISFIAMMLLFIIVGLLAMRQARHTSQDYLTASHSIPPWLAGLSAVATNNSGYMFVGMIGYTYTVGLSSIWLMVGWIVGDLMASLAVHKPFRLMAEKRDAHSFSSIIAHWYGKERLMLRRVAGGLTLLFLTVYASAQLVASSKAIEVILGWDEAIGATLAAGIILFYSFAGGLRASIWTDALQSMVMIGSMTLLLIVSVQELGGLSEVIRRLEGVNAHYMEWFPDHVGRFGTIEVIGFVVGWLFGGIAVVGQPHIMIRYMALDDLQSLNKMRWYYYSWFTLFYTATIIVGLLARIAIPSVEGFDAETALLVLSQDMLAPLLVGVMLAGLFAATISTADSLILSCSAALTRDFTKKPLNAYRTARMGTFIVTLSALMIALSNNQTVFSLVLDAWGVFGSAFAPILFLYAFGKQLSENETLILMGIGIGLFYLWSLYGWHIMYAIAPAFISVMLVYFLIFERRRTQSYRL